MLPCVPGGGAGIGEIGYRVCVGISVIACQGRPDITLLPVRDSNAAGFWGLFSKKWRQQETLCLLYRGCR